MRYIAIKSYKSTSSDPLIAPTGTKLRFERRNSEWAGWLWCTADDGKSAWVPEAWVKIDGNYCTLLRDYSSTELDVEIDDILQCELIESGWLWVQCARGQEGWVPLNCLRLLYGQ
jgi:hypothetical protein